jgi:GNAT superfamily N-acetyltransferase
MELIAQNFRLELARPNLQGLPAPLWPPGYSLRWFRPGDACHWLRIHHDAEPFDDITPEVFLREFGSDFNRLANCQCFLQDPNGRLIGTGTAWEDRDEDSETWGRVFWLAILRQHQGRGFGRLLLAAVCDRLRELGHTRARVTTSTGRPSAIALYLHFGFQPVRRTRQEYEHWDAMLDYLRQIGRLAPLTTSVLPMGDTVNTVLTVQPPA